MASAITLTATTTGDQMDVPGVVVDRVIIEPRAVQQRTTQFWGVNGESSIHGGIGGRNIYVPVLVYDAEDFDTARKLADYLEYTINTTAVGKHGKLKFVSESDHSEFADCRFDGAIVDPSDDVKLGVAGTLGGGYFALCIFQFRQLSEGAPEEEGP